MTVNRQGNKPVLDRNTVNSCDLLHRAILEVLADRNEIVIEPDTVPRAAGGSHG